MQDRTTRLEIAVFGWTGSDGLMADRTKQGDDLAAIKATLAQVRTLARLARWFILAAAGTLTAAGSDHIAAWLATLIKTTAAIVKP